MTPIRIRLRGGRAARARRVRVVLVLLAAAAITATALPTVLGWTSSPRWARETAGRALAEARSTDAARWAPEALAVAEAHARSAEGEIRRQEGRLPPWRDYRNARRLLAEAEEAARSAGTLSVERRDDASLSAVDRVETAACVVERLRSVQDGIRFGSEIGEDLRTAKLRLDEAEALVRFGEYDRARLRAENAIDSARRARQRMLDAVSRFVDADEVRRWKVDRDQAVLWSRRAGRTAIVVNKDETRLTLYASGRTVRSYDVDLGKNHLHRKLTVGDDATPEGRYRIDSKRGPGQTRYHRALGIDYPNDEDRRRHRDGVARRTVPAASNPGSLIEIHGDGGRGTDWTDGCVALANDDMDDLFRRVEVGTPVTIIGGDGDGGRFSGIAERLRSEDIEHACRPH